MKQEVEAKFLRVDFEDVRRKLTALGATCKQPMRLMRRALIEPPALLAEGRDAFLRIRDEGDRTTLTFKEYKDKSINGTYELETIVGDFDDTLQIFKQLGYDVQTYQESKRETWELGSSEVVLDEWPWLAPYIEIEDVDESAVRRTAELLEFDWSDHKIGNVDVALTDQYPDLSHRGFIDVPEVRFGDPAPEEFGTPRYAA